MTPTDSLIANLVPLLQAHGIRHFSLFTDTGGPRIYISGPGLYGPEASGRTFSEALADLDYARRDQDLLETLY